MKPSDQAESIRSNAAEIERLNTRIHESYRHRDENAINRSEWQSACAEFHARYDSLAFPGGLSGAYERIAAGDPETVDAALTFLEVRPYFFRSGYMWKDILRKCKRAPMSSEQSQRLAALLARYGEWKQRRDMSKRRGTEVRRDLSPLLLRLYGHFPISGMSDCSFDGLVSVGDLYILLCKKLKIAPCMTPESTNGVARKAYRRDKYPVGSADYWAAYRAWRGFPWTPEDVWATLVAEIIDLCKLDPSVEIVLGTILRKPGQDRQHEA